MCFQRNDHSKKGDLDLIDLRNLCQCDTAVRFIALNEGRVNPSKSLNADFYCGL